MANNIHTNNVERFAGFSVLYDESRPTPPKEVIQILTRYLSYKPKKLVDVGCGTGLSSFIWLGHAHEIIGIEPNDDMRQVAIDNWQAQKKPNTLRFEKGLSHQLQLESDTVDVITCSQSFHWMDPQPTLKEFARILKPGGVFAAYDCDWPPTFNKDIEESYRKIIAFADTRVSQLSLEEKRAYKWNKEEHLQQIRQSGLFSFSKEIVFHHWEMCDANRYTNIALSQGGLQTALKLGEKELPALVNKFRTQVEKAFDGKSQEVLFSYRMRLGIK